MTDLVIPVIHRQLDYLTPAMISCNLLDEYCLTALIYHNCTKTAFTNPLIIVLRL